MLLLYPSYLAAKYGLNLRIGVHYDVKPALSRVIDRVQLGDTIYLNWGANNLGDYYINRLHFGDLQRFKIVFGPSVEDADNVDRMTTYENDIKKLGPLKCVWIIFAMQRAEEEPYFLGILNRLGRPLEEHQFGVSSAFLYDLASPTSSKPQPKRKSSGSETGIGVRCQGKNGKGGSEVTWKPFDGTLYVTTPRSANPLLR